MIAIRRAELSHWPAGRPALITFPRGGSNIDPRVALASRLVERLQVTFVEGLELSYATSDRRPLKLSRSRV